ncbi:Gfo/Idh/MocA family protein [Daejeonella lutea]|uniref:Predicted dehydrogenase n=1 Tax=Daejeonella lutea TaxID=572036 RepID=A0A1T5FCF4_9SPHI|nr:Gfo/Idh/MocA family oxidoreductase [Daejeonella lutea]SKB93840.1 Predicted dehydrogenase [Daejeonella lutea]
MINVGIIGFGYWGPNLVRNFLAQKKCIVAAIAESKTQRQAEISKMYPGIRNYSDAGDLINDSTIDAVVIATPVFSHFPLALKALEQGKHVLLEKPMTSTVEEASILIDLAAKKGLTLMVDHTFLYTGAVQKINEIIANGGIGTVQYFDSTRINLGLFQPDVNVLWDLAPHDISILTYLVKDTPLSVNATGISHTKNGIENIAYMTVNYERDFVAHFNCSWTSPVKVRSTLIGGNEKMIVYNDLEPSEKVRIYDTGFNHTTYEDKNSIMVDYRVGDIYLPKIAGTEALFKVAEDFINSIENETEPLSSSLLGLNVVRILEASQNSIKNNGKEVRL